MLSVEAWDDSETFIIWDTTYQLTCDSSYIVYRSNTIFISQPFSPFNKQEHLLYPRIDLCVLLQLKQAASTLDLSYDSSKFVSDLENFC